MRIGWDMTERDQSYATSQLEQNAGRFRMHLAKSLRWLPKVFRRLASSLPAMIALWLIIGLAIPLAVLVLLNQPAVTEGLGLDAIERHDEATEIAGLDRWEKVLFAGGVVTLSAAIVGLVISYRKQSDAEDTKFKAEFAQAAAQLGSESGSVRLAGVYAMAAVADGSPELRQQCIDVLCGHLRLPYTPGIASRGQGTQTRVDTGEMSSRSPNESDTFQQVPGEREVRFTIIRVIRDRLRHNKTTSWRGYDFDFTGAVFDGGDFSGAEFDGGSVLFAHAQFVDGEITFDRVVFSGSRVNFDYASFSGSQISFSGARFFGGKLSFKAATFASGRVLLSTALFSGCEISFLGATFTGCDLRFSEARFSGGGHLSFEHAKFSRGYVRLDRTVLSGGDIAFDGAHFTGGGVAFHGTRFSRGTVSFCGAEFSGTHVGFNYAKFTGSEIIFDRAVFSGGELVFEDAEFSGGLVLFSEASFIGSNVRLDRAEYNGGVVSLEETNDWTVSPQLPVPVPIGLRLPVQLED